MDLLAILRHARAVHGRGVGALNEASCSIDGDLDAIAVSELVHARGGHGPCHVHDDDTALGRGNGGVLAFFRFRVTRLVLDRVPGVLRDREASSLQGAQRGNDAAND